jgi:hypothetical protein
MGPFQVPLTTEAAHEAAADIVFYSLVPYDPFGLVKGVIAEFAGYRRDGVNKD